MRNPCLKSSLILLLFILLWGPAILVGQQQNPDEIPGIGMDRNPDFGNDTNYGTPPQTKSFDQNTNPLNYPNPEEVNRNTINTSLIGISQGFIYAEWEHLTGRMFGFLFGATFYASELGQTRRLFQPAAIDTNYFMNLGGLLGMTFYVSQRYVRGLAIQIKLGGGMLMGSYKEAGKTEATNMSDFYGSLIMLITYRINLGKNIAISPVFNLGANVVILGSTTAYDKPENVPSFYRINGHSDLISLSAPAKFNNRLHLFIHAGFGMDLTFTF
ncbi:MAG: hypothetical protein AAF975_01420 [Spirochaetota bacterium]